MIVDSCFNQLGDKAIALEYLELLRVDISRQVKLVVASHWHDDHIRGLSQILRCATSARFACSAAIRSEEFLTLICAHDEIKLVEHTSGLSELAEVLAILQARFPSRYKRGPDHWVTEGTCLYSETTPNDVKVCALSPSAQTVTDSIGGLENLFPAVGRPIRRFPCLTPNDRSVVLLVKTTAMHLLLGADLEIGRDERRGWQGVLGSAVRPSVMCSGYKVAHHGSENADLDDLWALLLVNNSRAVLTPYARGSKPLPSVSDISRMKARTQHLYCTVWPPTRPPPRRSVDRTIEEIARSRRSVSKRPGHVRLRAPFGGGLDDIAIDLFDGSRRL
jgi:hypothetical protein